MSSPVRLGFDRGEGMPPILSLACPWPDNHHAIHDIPRAVAGCCVTGPEAHVISTFAAQIDDDAACVVRLPRVPDRTTLREALWDWIGEQSDAAYVIADCAWPQLTRLLSAAVADEPERGLPVGVGGAPFVVHELKSLLLGALRCEPWCITPTVLAEPLLARHGHPDPAAFPKDDPRFDALVVACAATRALTAPRDELLAGFAVLDERDTDEHEPRSR